MTAVQLFCFEDRAYLVTDGAGFDTQGRVAQLGSKIVMTGDCRMAVAWQGYASAQGVADALNRLLPAGPFPARLRALPAVLGDLRRAAVKAIGQQGQDFTVYAATWADDGPRCYVVTSVRSHGIKTMRLVETEGCMVPAVDVEGTLPAGGISAPRLDAIAMLLQQRKAANPLYGGASTVGGKCEMAIVSAGQIELVDLIAWPDKLGDIIAV